MPPQRNLEIRFLAFEGVLRMFASLGLFFVFSDSEVLERILQNT